jgi:hypothetical protein
MIDTRLLKPVGEWDRSGLGHCHLDQGVKGIMSMKLEA